MVTPMNWVVWDTFWSLVGSLIWFMTIVTHPDSVVVDRHPLKPVARGSLPPSESRSRGGIGHGD
jgi:hypothetical protein